MPVLEGAGGVLLFGGVFDPPHRAHVEIPQIVRDVLFGDRGWLVYVPAAKSPHKPDGPAASDADRVEMLRLATAGTVRVGIWTDEIDRGKDGASYWVDTLARAKSVLGELPLRFLIGADQAAAFDRWHDSRRILEMAEPAVVLREPIGTVEALASALRETGAWSEEEIGRWCGWVVDAPLMVDASTAVRDAIASGDVAGEFLPRGVGEYVRARGLYGTCKKTDLPSAGGL